MAKGNMRSVESRKSEIKSVNDSLKNKENKLTELESAYDRAMNARMEVENMEDLNSEVKSELRSENADRLQDLKEQGENLSDEMSDENKKLDDIRNENQEALAANREASSKMQGVGALMEKFGIQSKAMESLKRDEEAIQSVFEDLQESQQRHNELSNRARNLGASRRGG